MTEHSKGHGGHGVPLWGLFLALLALTAGEVMLYDLWVEYRFVPKYTLVLLILVFTLPKAAIVMIYFMHLKFEKQLIVLLAVVPFMMAGGAVTAILSDTLILKERAFNKVEHIGVYKPAHEGEGTTHEEHGKHPADGEHHDD